MKPFSLTVHQYREAKTRDAMERFGFADPEEIERQVKTYAIARQKYKEGLIEIKVQGKDKADFNPFTDDPGCKNCRKQKGDPAENPRASSGNLDDGG